MPKICLSVSENSTAQMWKTIHTERNSINMVELRIDTLDALNESELTDLVTKIKRENLDIVWTVRWSEEAGHFKDSEENRKQTLLLGDQLNVNWIDIEYRSNLWKNLKLKHAKLILSYHNFEKTENNIEILINNIEKAGADLTKVAFAANSSEDLRKVCALYNNNKKPLIAIAMGEFGECSRILPAVKGLPWTYASSSNKKTAPGQLNAFSLKNLYRFDQISEQTKVFCVIGDPVSHSLSPYVHNTLYASNSINAVYVKIHVDNIEEFYKIINIFNIKGVSATVPHKETILSKASPDHWLHKVGAANTMAYKENNWIIDNTDIAAAIESIQSLLQVETPKVLILGAGGAAKGLAWGMTRNRWKLTICNRSIEKAKQLCEQLKADILGWDDRNAHGFDVVVNCTTLGMQPNENTTPMEFEGSHTGLIAFDTVYTPEKTLFLQNAKEVGALTISGREMFYRQAAFQHGLWFEQQPPFEAMSEIMEKISESEN